ncbi:hypothetical protein [Spartinivicinus ruber]|uniref:hypothetical protein n=1 Tax=Spartinivicinus ruber TaxID=2683272 RepID=UPI0013D14713|nr:hypothetical protein [Spartinivicinus ruber]
MTQVSYEIPENIRELIIKVAFKAIESGCTNEAKAILEALAKNYPLSAASDIGYALIEIMNSNFSKAIRLLKNTLEKSTNCLEEARIVLLYAMVASGKVTEAKHEAKNMLEGELVSKDNIKIIFDEMG